MIAEGKVVAHSFGERVVINEVAAGGNVVNSIGMSIEEAYVLVNCLCTAIGEAEDSRVENEDRPIGWSPLGG